MELPVKKSRGQFFTTKDRVLDVMIDLIENNGSILEPSAGRGDIIRSVETKLGRNVLGIELDENIVNSKICESEININNFFNFIRGCEKYDTVIGNPPFVKLKNVESGTINLLPEQIPANGNLYYFFIKYSVSILNDNGELIFIVPKEWLYNVSSKFLRDYLAINGNSTHFIDCGEEKLFEDASVPSLCIFRYKKNYDGPLRFYESLEDYYNNKFIIKNTTYSNTIIFSEKTYHGKKLSDFFDVKVGLVTGAENTFKVKGQTNFPDDCLIDIIGTDGSLEKYLFVDHINTFQDIPNEVQSYLSNNKEKLINRKIKRFDETNWWRYGAIRNLETMNSNKKRIYGLMKTRQKNIFWKGNDFEFFGGGLVGLFLKDDIELNLDCVVNHLNSEEFKKIMKDCNMFSNNKVSITPSVLSNLPFPFEDCI